MKRRKSMTPEKRHQLRLDMRRRVAAAVPEPEREIFWKLLEDSDELISRGWQLRREAWALRRSICATEKTV